jgi:hypothetical protein
VNVGNINNKIHTNTQNKRPGPPNLKAQYNKSKGDGHQYNVLYYKTPFTANITNHAQSKGQGQNIKK